MTNVSLTISHIEAAFLAGSIIVMLHKKSCSRYSQLIGLSILNRLADEVESLDNEEIKEIVRTAVETAMKIPEKEDEEEHHYDFTDGIPTKDAEKFM
jgi:hypothetical protein